MKGKSYHKVAKGGKAERAMSAVSRPPAGRRIGCQVLDF
jgi:hypothetical protein